MNDDSAILAAGLFALVGVGMALIGIVVDSAGKFRGD